MPLLSCLLTDFFIVLSPLLQSPYSVRDFFYTVLYHHKQILLFIFLLLWFFVDDYGRHRKTFIFLFVCLANSELGTKVTTWLSMKRKGK